MKDLREWTKEALAAMRAGDERELESVIYRMALDRAAILNQRAQDAESRAHRAERAMERLTRMMNCESPRNFPESEVSRG